MQYGVTGGGNDGSAFVRYGSVDVALGWPLRYSHSPAEVVDTRDVDSLGRIITVYREVLVGFACPCAPACIAMIRVLSSGPTGVELACTLL